MTEHSVLELYTSREAPYPVQVWHGPTPIVPSNYKEGFRGDYRIIDGALLLEYEVRKGEQFQVIQGGKRFVITITAMRVKADTPLVFDAPKETGDEG